MRKPLKKALLDHINSTEGWIKKVDLYLVGDRYEFSAESVGRQLRSLEEEGLIKVDYYNGKYAKNLAKYARLNHQDKQPTLTEIIKPDGTRVMRLCS